MLERGAPVTIARGAGLPALVLEVRETHVRCQLEDGRAVWVPTAQVTPRSGGPEILPRDEPISARLSSGAFRAATKVDSRPPRAPSERPPASPRGVGAINPYTAPTLDLPQAPSPTGGLGWLLFSFQGRIGRRQYWLGNLLVALGIFFAGVGAGICLYVIRQSTDSALGKLVLVLVVAPLVILGLWWSLALTVKRWHDRNKSGLWTLILLLPYLGSLWTLIENGFLPGTVGPNDYGPDPRE